MMRLPLAAIADIPAAEDHLLATIFLTAAAPAARPARGEQLASLAVQATTVAGRQLDGFFDRVDFTALSDRQATSIVDHADACLSRASDPAVCLAEAYQETRALSTKQARGAFFTPTAVADVIAAMALGDNPKAGLLIADPACGAGALLARAHAHIRKTAGVSVAASTTFVGVEIDARTAQVARACLLLAGMDPDQFWVATGDALRQQIVATDNDGRLRQLAPHVVLANPPFGQTPGHLEPRAPLVVPDRVLRRPVRVDLRDHRIIAAAAAMRLIWRPPSRDSIEA